MNEELIQAALQGDEQAIQQLVAAAMQGDEQATQIIQQAAQAAEQGDQNAAQFVQMVQQVAQQMQAQSAQMARNGAKIQYLRSLKKQCAEDEELVYFKVGGKMCKKCQKKAQKAACGKKMKKEKGGAISDFMAEYKAKGGLLKNKNTAFGDTDKHNPRTADKQGHKPNHKNRTGVQEKPKVNRFTAFGDVGKYKPTNVGLVGHRATGATGRLQSKQTVKDTVNKHTAFGAHINRYLKTGKASTVGGIKQGGKSRSKTGIFKIK